MKSENLIVASMCWIVAGILLKHAVDATNLSWCVFFVMSSLIAYVLGVLEIKKTVKFYRSKGE